MLIVTKDSKSTTTNNSNPIARKGAKYATTKYSNYASTKDANPTITEKSKSSTTKASKSPKIENGNHYNQVKLKISNQTQKHLRHPAKR